MPGTDGSHWHVRIPHLPPKLVQVRIVFQFRWQFEGVGAIAGYDVSAGDRIAQLIIMPVIQARFLPVEELPDSVRGDGGFGSTGYQASMADDASAGEGS